MRRIPIFLKKRLASLALFSIELIIVWTVFLGSIIVFLFVSKEIFHSKEENFDKKVFDFLNKLIHPSFTKFMEAITFLASKEFIIPASLLILVYFVFIKKHRWFSLKIPVVAIGSISLNLVLKNIFNRPRPLLPHLVDASGLSYPSGHAMISFSFYGLLIYMAWHLIPDKTLKWVVCMGLLILIHLIGFSRVYLRVHYASDVMAGFAVGIIWLVVSIFVLKKIEKYSAKRLAPLAES
jgi:membrane-associated phospholipid phosphatase